MRKLFLLLSMSCMSILVHAQTIQIFHGDPNTKCPLFPVTFSSQSTVTGNNPVYEWYQNGLLIGNLDFIDMPIYNNGDQFRCLLISDDPSRTQDSVWSNIITVQLENPIRVTVDTGICVDGFIIYKSRAYTIGGTYYDTFQTINGCDSIIKLDLRIESRDTIYKKDTICSSRLPYSFLDTLILDAGVHTVTRPKPVGCETVNILTLTVFKSDTTLVSASTCADTPFFFNGAFRTSTGLYEDTLVNKKGCDSFIQCFLTVHPRDSIIIRDSFCIGGKYFYGAVALTSPGTYVYPYRSINGCDSFETLVLSLRKRDSVDISRKFCPGTQYVFHSKLLDTPGVYIDTLMNSSGCDSIVRLTLTLNKKDTTYLFDTICKRQNYTFGTQTLTDSGTYIRVVPDVNNCDSTLILKLTKVFNTTSVYKKDTICSNRSYILNGIRLYSTGIYTDTLISVKGCDSIVTIDLVVNKITDTSYFDSICDGEKLPYRDSFIRKPGIYTYIGRTVLNCDSIIKLYVSLIDGPRDTIVRYVCPDQRYFYGGKYLLGEGFFTDTLTSYKGCDSIVVLELKRGLNDSITQVGGNQFVSQADTGVTYQWYECFPWKRVANETKRTFTTTTAGSYALVINNGLCSDTSQCMVFQSLGVVRYSAGRHLIYPVPTNDVINVQLASIQRNTRLTIYDAVGRLMMTKIEHLKDNISWSLGGLSTGIYFMYIEQNGKLEIVKIEKN